MRRKKNYGRKLKTEINIFFQIDYILMRSLFFWTIFTAPLLNKR